MPGRGSPLDWRAKVELFEEIRREYEFGVGTIAGVARKVKVHRRMVREAIASALPKPLSAETQRATACAGVSCIFSIAACFSSHLIWFSRYRRL
jgi:hypothetical protein